MFSDDCFTNSLKWNENFFKKIRMSFSDHISKSSYYGIYHERLSNMFADGINNNQQKKEFDEKNKNKENEEEDLFKDFDFGEDLRYANKKKYLELHVLVGNNDIIAFRLSLNEVYDENPINTIMMKLLEFEKIENLKLLKIQNKYSENETEIEKVKSTLVKKELLLENQKKEFIYKFYLLNNEKNRKIKELKHDQ